ncbi:MAG: tetratricopeptide repeat protein, partial [Rhodospirillales bacterium]|nr:tetratricopeptide repeat protein [Rhodospirillales bacterium]
MSRARPRDAARKKAPGGGPVAGLLAEAVRHHRRGRLDQAGSLYQRILKAEPRHADALHLLGLVRHQEGDQMAAGDLIAAAIANNRANAAYHNSLGLVHLAKGDAAAAIAAFGEALARDPLLVEAFNNLGNAQQKAGRAEDAVRSYDHALALRPDYAEALCNKGRALHGLDALAPAAESLRAALRLRPDYAKAQRVLGDVLAESGRTDDARASFRRALALEPEDGETLAALAALEERAGQLEPALATAERALVANARDIRAAVVAARCERRLGRVDEALARLRGLSLAGVDAEGRAHVAFEQGASLDRVGAYDAAYAAYAEANALAEQSPQAQAVDHEAMPRLVATLRRTFTAEWLATWTPSLTNDGPAPVFLIGFPRSGTTLLDQILDAHPGLQTLEEKPAIDVVRHAVAAMPGGYPAALAGLDGDDVLRLRRAYFDEVARYLEPAPAATLV